MRQAVDILIHVHIPFVSPCPFLLPALRSYQRLSEKVRMPISSILLMLILVCDTDGLSRANWFGQFSFCARPWQLSYATAATTNLPTRRLLKVLYVLNTRYETTFPLQFELLIISSYNYLALRTDLGALPTILPNPGSEAAFRPVTSTLRCPHPNLSPRSVLSTVLTPRYVYHIYFQEPELNSSRPSPAPPSAPRLPDFLLNL